MPKLDSRRLDRHAYSKLHQARDVEVFQVRRSLVGDTRHWPKVCSHLTSRAQHTKFIGRRIEAHQIPLTSSIIQRRRTLWAKQEYISLGFVVFVVLRPKFRTVLVEMVRPLLGIREWHSPYRVPK